MYAGATHVVPLKIRVFACVVQKRKNVVSDASASPAKAVHIIVGPADSTGVVLVYRGFLF